MFNKPSSGQFLFCYALLHVVELVLASDAFSGGK
jgi:hypothetical protein